MTNHTAGPWKWNEDFNEIQAEDGNLLIAYPATNGSSLFDRSSLEKPDPDEWMANAHLIAAAPLLAKQLRALYGAMADLLDHVTGMSDEEPTPIFEGAERALVEAADALDAAGLRSHAR